MKNYNKKILTLHMRLNKSADVRVRKIIRAEIDRLAQEERELKKVKVKEITMQNGKKYFIPNRT